MFTFRLAFVLALLAVAVNSVPLEGAYISLSASEFITQSIQSQMSRRLGALRTQVLSFFHPSHRVQFVLDTGPHRLITLLTGV